LVKVMDMTQVMITKRGKMKVVMMMKKRRNKSKRKDSLMKKIQSYLTLKLKVIRN